MNYPKCVELNTIPAASVSLLIGADIPEKFCIKSFRKGLQGTPAGIDTSIGWSLLRPSLPPLYESNCQVNFVRKLDDDVEQVLSNTWDADFQTGTSVLQSSKDRVAHERLKSSIGVTCDADYQVPLLWKDQDTRLPSNITMAKQRLSSLKRKFFKDSTLKEKYFEVISAYLTTSHAKQIANGTQESNIT